ncbi:hypothetical protein EW146_g5732 [Bondarzewia mesenterica]|uniref:Uncharacterized protein n=1 Tax=Bondarzewia mesenterica TaxID=1095465 RepID=A0A4S4LR77_9AGAM|nr:hypothetical protein EW146_g5732 [Bondarzewia mesenterica]
MIASGKSPAEWRAHLQQDESVLEAGIRFLDKADSVEDELRSNFTHKSLKRNAFVWLMAILVSAAMPILCVYALALHYPWHAVHKAPAEKGYLAHYPLPPNENSSLCPQTTPLFPFYNAGLDDQLEKLTESYDDLRPVGQDPRWNVFGDLHSFLQSSFPLIYEKLTVNTVNTYALVYHWQGSDNSLKPILLTAHQDVVPVESTTVDQWQHPPYSGYNDGTWIWGRGSADDKADLVAQLVTIDSLLKEGFIPRRTIVLAFGIDEEASGRQSHERARDISQNILSIITERMALPCWLMKEASFYGQCWRFRVFMSHPPDGYTIQPGDKTVLAFPDVSEKGYLDARVEVNVPGGHSSVPPAHTVRRPFSCATRRSALKFSRREKKKSQGIGILSSIINLIEANPHVPSLPRDSTPFRGALCQTAYAHTFPDDLREVAIRAIESDSALDALRDRLLSLNPMVGATLSTTQAVDLVWGGVKVNALPESATAVVNHRIAEYSSVGELQKHLTDLITPLAVSFNLSVKAFGETVRAADEGVGEVVLSDAWNTALEPSPITPTGENGAWKLLSGTIKATIESRSEGAGAAVIPHLAVVKYVFREYGARDADCGMGWGVAVRADEVVDEVRFFTKLILNADESALLD